MSKYVQPNCLGQAYLPSVLRDVVGIVVEETPLNLCVEYADWKHGHSGPFDDGRTTCWNIPKDWMQILSMEVIARGIATVTLGKAKV